MAGLPSGAYNDAISTPNANRNLLKFPNNSKLLSLAAQRSPLSPSEIHGDTHRAKILYRFNDAFELWNREVTVASHPVTPVRSTPAPPVLEPKPEVGVRLKPFASGIIRLLYRYLKQRLSKLRSDRCHICGPTQLHREGRSRVAVNDANAVGTLESIHGR